jgi:hypothetical protein
MYQLTVFNNSNNKSQTKRNEIRRQFTSYWIWIVKLILDLNSFGNGFINILINFWIKFTHIHMNPNDY